MLVCVLSFDFSFGFILAEERVVNELKCYSVKTLNREVKQRRWNTASVQLKPITDVAANRNAAYGYDLSSKVETDGAGCSKRLIDRHARKESHAIGLRYVRERSSPVDDNRYRC